MGLIRILSHNKLFILLTLLMWLIVGCFKLSTNFNEKSEVKLSLSNIHFIFEFLSKLNVNLLLIDPYVLDYLFIRNLPFEQLQKRVITFGISDDSIRLIIPLFSLKNCSIRISKNFETTSIDHIFIEYNQQIIHIAILHQQQSYFLIQKNIAQLPYDIKLTYGDIDRVIQLNKTEFMKDKYFFSFPRNVSHFLWLYKTSEFLQCNRMLANKMESQYNLKQNPNQLDLTILPMRNIVNGLNELEKHYWLAGGTLLGWYRHCGFIPYTQDVDFGLFAEEYNESIRNYFLGNPVIYLWGALGLVNDSLEFRLFTGRYTFDLFWAYREHNYRWCGYQTRRVKFRRILPLLPKLCSGDLFGYIFTIPCSPIDYLNNEYGVDTWIQPLEKKYKWVNMKYDSMWDDISWMYAVRLYTSDGKLRTDKFAIDWIVNQFNYSLKTIPSFLNVLPNKSVTLPSIKNLKNK